MTTTTVYLTVSSCRKYIGFLKLVLFRSHCSLSISLALNRSWWNRTRKKRNFWSRMLHFDLWIDWPGERENGEGRTYAFFVHVPLCLGILSEIYAIRTGFVCIVKWYIYAVHEHIQIYYYCRQFHTCIRCSVHRTFTQYSNRSCVGWNKAAATTK